MLLLAETAVESISFPKSITKNKWNVDFLFYFMNNAYGGTCSIKLQNEVVFKLDVGAHSLSAPHFRSPRHNINRD